ncbi:MAG: TatD family hydrolase [Alphaproteobacteria bacterium]|jgi:TatD DNase family protein|nr:LuxR family transcriptional regulator [Rhodospirillaceae bacterium]MDP6031944.1 TatD family hydrolase [Alphaproteobacteria bacterium]MDP7183249.1 TatD family hydrolase [Alphaproteobacteria bacterium]MDP7191092.1 TatD family hydrolase [Alphaproteobacteria bacterium]HJO88380.1 TatD family hydrolase [Alphaproteobacteria bacterium]|tara:strand:- start:1859 stop:2701 length:843 start_codon:yes stop_codon:yes gene_type:complete
MSGPFLVDSHCHLDFSGLSNDLEGVIGRANHAGVGAMLTISTRLDRFESVCRIAENHDNIWCSVGVHPHEADREVETATPKQLLKLARHPRVVGIGETGLDFHYMHSDRRIQEVCFRNHLAAARESSLPAIVHMREAENDTIRILTDEATKGPLRGVIHCFSSDLQFAEKALEIGFYISFSGIVTFKRAEALRQVVARIPLERLLIETDAPYLAPMPKRGKRNEPAFIAHTAAKVGEILGLSREKLACTTTANFFRLFPKAKMSGEKVGLQAQNSSESLN